MRALRLFVQIVPRLSKAGDNVPIPSKFRVVGGGCDARVVSWCEGEDVRGGDGAVACAAVAEPVELSFCEYMHS